VTTFKLATYNLENLFSRPRIFEEDSENSSKLLRYADELQAELRKEIFDHDKIADLEKKLSGYVIINDIRGSHKKAKGSNEWFGFVEFVRAELNVQSALNTARVLQVLNADIQIVIEVENRIVLQKFHDDILYKQFLQPNGQTGYEYIYVIDGNDERGIDVGIMSKYEVLSLNSHIHEKTEYNGEIVPLFGRDCLEVDVKLPNGKILHLLINHLKSMGYNVPGDFLSNHRRLAQARRVAEIIQKYDLKKDLVVVGGDFNSPPTSPSLAPLLSNPHLFNVNETLPEDQRGTYRTGKDQIDYLLVSDPLRQMLQTVEIERRGLYSRKYKHFDTVTDRKTEASDHSAVSTVFNL
jgi:endonuclease/exonuclease/phosphatase family metal-dependent hydrolase